MAKSKEVKGQSEEVIRKELANVIHSKSFRQGERLQRFLQFIVEEALSGRGDQLKEYPIGVDVFGKDTSFDPRMDPIVRVQARRLRMRLQTYYREEGQSSEIVIELPKGGYNPTFRNVGAKAERRTLPPALVSRNTATVLPFEDCSPAGTEHSFCNALTSEVIFAISRLGSIVVVDSAIAHAEGISPAAVSVAGTVAVSNGIRRITVRLTDTVRGHVLWTDKFDRAMDNNFSVQEDVSAHIAEALKAELLQDVNRSARAENLAAHNMYLQGRYQLAQRTESGLKKSLEYFQKSMEEDPGFAPAYAGMADAQLIMLNYGVAAPTELWTKVASNAAHAVMLDEDSSEARTTFAHVKAIQDWDWTASEQEFRRAISLNPRNPFAHHWYAISCLTPTGRMDEALQEIQIAQSLDPISSIIARDMAQILHFRREYDRALEQCDYTIEQNPHFSAAYWTLGLVQEQRGELEESIAAYQRAIELSPPNPRVMGSLARTYIIVGRKREGLQILEELEEMSQQRYISPFELALIYFALHRMDDGFRELDLAFQHRCFELITLRSDPRFDPVRKDERYQVLFNKLGLPQC